MGLAPPGGEVSMRNDGSAPVLRRSCCSLATDVDEAELVEAPPLLLLARLCEVRIKQQSQNWSWLLRGRNFIFNIWQVCPNCMYKNIQHKRVVVWLRSGHHVCLDYVQASVSV